MKRVLVTGLGIVSPYGAGRGAFWEGLAAGRCAIGPIGLFDTEGFRARVGAEVPGGATLPHVSSRRSRADRFALMAADEAVRDAGLTRADLRPAAVIVGGIGGGMLEAESWFWRRERDGVDDPKLRTALRTLLPFAHADVVARRYGTTGPKETVVLACSSGGAALGLAAELVASGEVPLALAGGVDAMTRICFMGFNALKLLDPEPCRPFARDRRGMSLGEGAGFVVLEGEAHVRARGAGAYAELCSYGLTTDAWHLTAPQPDGEGGVRAMAEALDRAGIPASAVGYVNAHGTGTSQNDRVEAAALRKVFDPDAVLVSANKSLVGHAMAAAGALEAIGTVLTLVHQLVPPTANLSEPDPEIAFDCVPGVARPASLEYALSNSFGFGGQNLSLLFRRAATPRSLDASR
ncbi:MAG TPA: beta-ketoacyl-[acyl-carrier-protein] synthase family protein [Methylomirabilota bacterium]